MHPALAVLAAALILPAHASVIGSTPTDGDVVTAQPSTFSVVMNEEILVVEGADGANAMQVTDASGLFYGDGCVSVDGDTVSLDVQLGEAGDYTMTFQVVSADGHAVSDTVDFAFDPAEGEAGEPGAAEAPVCGAPAETDPGTETDAGTETDGATESDGVAESNEVTAPVGEGEAAGEAPAEGDGGAFPFVAIGVLAVLAVLAFIAYRANRLRGDVEERRDDEA